MDREELKHYIDGCFVNVELADNTDEREYWKCVDELIDWHIAELKKAKQEGYQEGYGKGLGDYDGVFKKGYDQACKDFNIRGITNISIGAKGVSHA
jgi:hypothetical protein